MPTKLTLEFSNPKDAQRLLQAFKNGKLTALIKNITIENKTNKKNPTRETKNRTIADAPPATYDLEH